MQRWLLVNNNLVRGYLLTEGEPTVEQKRRLAFGANDDESVLADAGTWVQVPLGPPLIGDDWTFDGTNYAPPVRISDLGEGNA